MPEFRFHDLFLVGRIKEAIIAISINLAVVIAVTCGVHAVQCLLHFGGSHVKDTFTLGVLLEELINISECNKIVQGKCRKSACKEYNNR
jgi:hypothetical protein